jgi:competence protein ComEC
VRELKWEIKEAFYKTGTGHVLALSGLHVGIIFLTILSILRFFLPGIYVPIVASAVVWVYAYLVGFMPSVVRASTLLTFFSLSVLLSKPVKPMNVLALSLLFSLMVKPLWVFSPSLWLSYSAVAGLFALEGRIKSVLGASLFSLPFALKYFGKFAILYIPINLIVIPLMTVFMYSQILALLLPYPFTYSASLFYNVMEWTVTRAASLNLPPLTLNVSWLAAVFGEMLILSAFLYKDFVSAKPQL